MDMSLPEGLPEVAYIVLGIGAGSGLTWLTLAILYQFRKAALMKDAAKSALARSRTVLKGQAAEQLAPLTGDFPYLASDARFLGSPIDYVVFDGLSDEEELEVVFVEVKTGASKLSKREAKLRDAIKAGRVRWEELRL